MKIFKIGETVVVVDDYADHVPPVRSYLPDGGTVHAKAHDTEEYNKRARNLGYASGVEMNADHDLTHAMLAEWLGLPVSPALQMASRQEDENLLSAAEEDAVMAIQRYANIAGVKLIQRAKELYGKK